MQKIKIPLQEPIIEKHELSLVTQCIKSKQLSFKGKYVKKFEKKFEKFIGGGNAVTVSNGTTAIELALATFGISSKDEVIIPNYCFAAVINAVLNIGAKPVIVDVEQGTWTINPLEIKKKINLKTKAVIAVHTYGIVCDMQKIKKILKGKKIILIEDCAEALGSKYMNKRVGNLADCSTFSFYPNKTITTGEGGMVVFKKKIHFQKSLLLRNQGRDSNDTFFYHISRGYNFRMTNFQAALGFAQMYKINNLLKNRKLVFKIYNDILKSEKKLELIPKPHKTENSYWLYTLKIKDFSREKRNKLINNLKNKGIEARPGFYPLSEMIPYKYYAREKYLNSKKISFCSISLPSSPNLSVKKNKLHS